MIATRRCLVLSALFFLAASAGSAATREKPNVNVVRIASGTHSFFEKDGVTMRGREYFRMIVHGDGSRSMVIVKNMFGDDRQNTIVMRVDRNYRPEEVFASYRYPEGFKGSVWITLAGDRLHAASSGPGGQTAHDVTVPQEISIVTHAEGLNSWNASVADPSDTAQGGGPTTLARTTYFISPIAGADGPVLGSLRKSTLTRVGEETITVPAGTFETIHYATGDLDVWAMKGDRILVRQRFKGEDYVLTEYREE